LALPKKKKAEQPRYYRDQTLLVKDANIWTGNGLSKGSILIANGRIKRTARRIEGANVETIDASRLYALPGMIDAHVHLRDTRLAYKEDFATGTAAAAAGGFTTVLDMPNSVPPTDSPQRLIERQRMAARKIRVNVGFHAAATPNRRTIVGLAQAGASSLKLYMPRPIAQLDISDDSEIRQMMIGSKQTGIPVTVHAEDLSDSIESPRIDSFEQLAKARPSILETRAVERIVRIQEMTGSRVHFCHLTLASSLRTIRESSPRITSEATPHHLLLSSRALRRLGWRAWMVPPLRSEAERRMLLAAVRSGSCDIVASDHAPHSIREKKRRPQNSLPGVPGLETTLPLMLTLVNKGILELSHLIKLLAENPARIFSLKSKAKIRPGYDGDLVLVDMKKKNRIDSSSFRSKAKYSPFDGFQTKGAVVSTIVGGSLVYSHGEVVGRPGCGSVLRSRFSD
jgi:dihydroorotase